jgi:hypothetical protein
MIEWGDVYYIVQSIEGALFWVYIRNLYGTLEGSPLKIRDGPKSSIDAHMSKQYYKDSHIISPLAGIRLQVRESIC